MPHSEKPKTDENPSLEKTKTDEKENSEQLKTSEKENPEKPNTDEKENSEKPKAEEKPKKTFWTEYEKFTKVFKLFPLTINIIRPQLKAIAYTYFLSLTVTCLGMLEPKYVGTIVDIVTRSKDTDDLKALIIKMVVFSALLRLAGRANERASNRATAQFKNSAKGDIYKSLLNHNMAFFDKMSTGEAAEAITSGVDTLEYLYFNQFINTLQTLFNLVGSFFLMYTISPRLTFIVAGLTPAKLLLTYLSMKSNSDYYSEVGKLWSAVWTLPNQAISNISLVKSFSTESKEHKELVEKQAELTRIQDKRDGGFWDLHVMISLVENALGAILIWFGGVMAFQGALTPGELSTFNLYYSNFSGSFSSLNYSVKWLYSSFMETEKLLKVLDEGSNAKVQESKNITKPNLKGCIEINNLSFNYPSKPDVEILKDINLKINAGTSVAFVGASGSGKTTMVSLLQNLYTANQGEIIVDGERIEDYDVAWLHQHVGYVSQEPVLFAKSVEENIAYGLESHTPEQIDKALELSNSKFILNKEKFPDGLKTMIGAEGIKLSGGQKQRLAIARAFVKDPKILILDEPTSALDGESESKVQKAIDELTGMGDRTVVVVAHRLSTIINCSKIVVFEDGKIVEEGSHKELIEKNGAYKKLFEFQMDSMKKL